MRQKSNAHLDDNNKDKNSGDPSMTRGKQTTTTTKGGGEGVVSIGM